jgi:hypothetical protein
MACHRMMIVAESAGIKIHVDETIKAVSFANSPYYAHMHLAAIDIYPKSNGDFAPSPVEGRVIGIRATKAPSPTHFKADEDEELILIANDARLTTKVLHLRSAVNVGDKVDVSTPIGEYVRSGFFNFWTGYHIHVEVRPKDDPIRARGSFPVAPRLLEDHEDDGRETIDPDNIPCEVVSIAPEHLLLKPPCGMLGCSGGYVGLKVFAGDGGVGILDGGLPHYGVGGVLLSNADGVRAGSSVMMGDLQIGEILGAESGRSNLGRYYNLVKFTKELKIRLSGRPLRGLSLSLGLSASNSTLLKVVPQRPFNKEELQTFEDKGVLSIGDGI